MLTASQLYEEGQLAQAVAALNEDLRRQPLDNGKRYFLAELLCFAGDWERADKQLDLLMHQDASLLPGVLLFRQLLRAAKAREQFFMEGRIPEFLEEPSAHLQSYLKASISIREGRLQETSALCNEAERQRPVLPGTCNDQAISDFRDLDDLTAGVLEVLTGAGQYYWFPMERIDSIALPPPRRPRDMLWRPAHVTLLNGPESDFFLPVIYPGSETSEILRLGRSTEWLGGENAPVRGLGQRMFLAGDDVVSLMEIQELKLAQRRAGHD